ncbi:MAG TPA: prepilin-type N-terminal cleavage/methylation domain-containing protein [Solirubrobacterales bacterium]|nr:prepilin-type N-terminal cleavage/methylation domain-containing protein [Solirubrobacterales bacterium]
MVARLREDAGFTLIEVLVAALILTLASAALFGVLAAGARNGARAKATQIALDRAQQEMEKLHSLSYEELALTKTPQHFNSPLDPNNRVVNNNFALKREPQEELAPMVANGGPIWGSEKVVEHGVVKPGPIAFENGEVRGHLYRYIVWREDPSCPASLCPGYQDYKQLIVAVKLDSTGSESRERNYVEVQSTALDPKSVGAPQKVGSGGTGGTGGGGTEGGSGESAGTGSPVTAQQFFLTDTPCSDSGVTLREEITGDHLLHNTLGTCASGPHTGTTLGAPDALLLGAPPDPDPEDETNPALYNYSNDGYLETNPDTGKGVQIKRDDTSGCHFDPTGTVHPESQVHRWVTDPFVAEFKMSGKVTLEFYTRTLNDALYHGTLCVYLFKRHKISEAEEENSFLANKETGLLYWTYTPQGNGFWPRNAWTKVRLPMEFAPTEISAKDRLGVALSVDPGNTDAEAIPIMYDHPNYPTRIEVNTTTPTEGG